MSIRFANLSSHFLVELFKKLFLIFFFQGGKTPEKSGDSSAQTDKVTPSRYNAIASLDEALTNEDENWQERTSIITKIDHENYTKYAQEFVNEVADCAVSLG